MMKTHNVPYRIKYFVLTLFFSLAVMSLIDLIHINNQKILDGCKQDNQKGIHDLISTCKDSLSPEYLYNLFIKNKYLIPPSKLPYNLNEDHKGKKYEDFYQFYKRHSSWRLIKSILTDFYKDKPPGFFIEAGAMDGEYNSNTLYLERNLSWTGLLVEGNKNNYKLLERKNRKSWISPLCLATKSCPHEELSTTYPYANDQMSFWLTRSASAIVAKKDINLKNVLENGLTSFDKALCVPVHYFLDALNITKVDFFSLDVEGSEVSILKYFPFDRIQVDLWAIEHVYIVKNLHNATILREHTNFIEYMESKGYYLFDILCRPLADYIFVRIDSQLFTELSVPYKFLKRRNICNGKPPLRNSLESLDIIRDKTHWPSLKFKQNL